MAGPAQARAGQRQPPHQAALAAAVSAVLARLDRLANVGPSMEAGPSTAPGAGAAADPGGAETTSALAAVVGCLGLTPFERDVLVLAAAAEVDPSTATRCAKASGDPLRPYPTFSLALAALTDPHWSALTPAAPLRRWHLIELDDETYLTGSRIRIDERILHFLAGVRYLDPRLRGLMLRVDPPGDIPAPHQAAADALAALWATTPAADRRPLAGLTGADRQTRREITAWTARRAGLNAYVLQPADLPGDPAERDALARLWEREAILLPAALLIEVQDAERDRCEPFCAALGVPVVLSAAAHAPFEMITTEIVAVPPLAPEDQLQLWRSALNGDGDAAGLAELTTQFSLPAHAIRAATAAVRRQVAAVRDAAGFDTTGPDTTMDISRLAWQAGLAEARVGLDELGRRIEPRAAMADLVLPGQQRAVLDEIVAHVRQRVRVHEEWGFSGVLRRGLGVTALFAGGTGTGKTLAAEVVAGALGLDLFVVDLSQIVSKYIGETEKNLRRVFDAAERGGAVLLFDEADALFGKRSEVKDSHDRYANIEVSYLLMRMEAYRGLAVLTTNMRKALDSAFLRRLRFVVEFPFPGPVERAEIWRRVIPPRAPADRLDFARLGQLTVTGGNIRNIALSAAFLAADEGAPITMRHMKAAAHTEYLKLERSITPAEVAGWE
jgi:ATPase family associated with various cellular activities (AAA)/Winged helix domain, variant